MSTRTTALVLSLAAGAMVALAGTVSAQTCPAGCGLQKKACVDTARVTKLMCKADCRTNTPPTGLGACMMGCVGAFRTAKDDCQTGPTGLTACLGTCSPPTPPSDGGACLGTCGQDLGTCAQGVVADAKTCVSGCATAADRLTCLQGCAATAQSEAATCASDFSTCVAGCGATTTTVPSPPSCAMSSAPACGGSCPGAASCVAVTPTRCACMGG